jgi:hypothetical protein
MNRSQLMEILDYDPETGKFTWKKSRGRARAGDTAGSVNKDGYVVIGKEYAHRLAFLFMTGCIPSLVDHRDLDTGNNRWRNLRAATKAGNSINRGISKANSSGLKGVSWHAGAGKWQAHIRAEGRSIYLGLFDSAASAHEAYMRAATKYHPEFARAA